MARPVYSFSFVAEDLAVGGVVTYEVPPGFTPVIRDITGRIEPATGSGAYVTVQADTYIVAKFPGAPGCDDNFHGDYRLVLPGTSEIVVTLDSTDSGATASIFISGYLLAS